MVRNKFGELFGALVCFGLAACGQTGIRLLSRSNS